MIYPSISELSDKGVNRYVLSLATAKCARKITEEHLEKTQGGAETKEDKFSAFTPKKIVSNEKPVKEAILRLYSRDFKIVLPENK